MRKWIILLNGDLLDWNEVQRVFPKWNDDSKCDRVYSKLETKNGLVYDFLDVPENFSKTDGITYEFNMVHCHIMHGLTVKYIEESNDCIIDLFHIGEYEIWEQFIASQNL